MKILLIILLLNQIWRSQHTLSSHDLCNRAQHQLKCPDTFNFTCKSDKCSLDKLACNKLSNLNYQIRVAKNLELLKKMFW